MVEGMDSPSSCTRRATAVVVSLLVLGGVWEVLGSSSPYTPSAFISAAVSHIHTQSSSPLNPSILSFLASTPNLSNFLVAIKARSNLEDILNSKKRNLTVFAFTNSALIHEIDKRLLNCIRDFYVVTPCSSLEDLLSATNLEKILLNHMVEGVFSSRALRNGELLQFLGDNVEKVTKEENGTFIGKSVISASDVYLSNGIVHILDSVLGSIDPSTLLSSDVSLNASAVLASIKLADVDVFNSSKRKEMAEGARVMNIPGFQLNRGFVAFPDGGMYNPSVLTFDPSLNSKEYCGLDQKFKYPVLANVAHPGHEEDIAFMTVLELGALIRNKKVTSKELVNIFLKRLKRYNCVLEVVISYTEKLAYEQADKADKLLAQGIYLGPLHGIPYGLKDIIAVPGYRTTWGSTSFKNQVIYEEAWVYKRLKEAGAVLIAKLVTGSLAYDDIWFGGRTRNPWNIEEFSTGSSAGPASATSAGLIPFAIGSETAGSITYPGARCGVTAFRPTFGMVGRSWVLSLSETLDKLGPFCRSAVDCAIILDIIRGKDPNDISSKNIQLKDPFTISVDNLTVGYLPDADMEVVRVLQRKGVNVVPFKLNYTVESVQAILNFTMDVAMLSHFDHWQRAGLDDEYEAQDQWPIELRRARLIPAVDFIQSQRARGKLIKEVMASLEGVDAFIGNVTDWEKVCVGNLVGMPVMVLPSGLKNIPNLPPGGTKRRTTVTTGIYGAPFRDAEVLALAMAYQEVTTSHLERPPINDLDTNDFQLKPAKCPPTFGEV